MIRVAALLLATAPLVAHAQDDATRAQLEALGYFDSAPTDNPEERGVTQSSAYASPGYTLYSSRHTPTAHLVDLAGASVHEWRDSVKAPWMHVWMLPNGDLLALAKDAHLVKVDWDSNVLWRHRTRSHHDFALDGSGQIYLLSRARKWRTLDGTKLPILADKLEVLSSDGKLLRSVWLDTLVADLHPKRRLRSLAQAVAKGGTIEKLAVPEKLGDVTHTNSVQVLERAVDGLAPAGSILLSMRELDRILVLDPDMKRVLWSWGAGEIDGQHHATLLDNGNIMLFDNGVGARRSRVIEIAPRSGKIVWSHTAKGFFTRLRGSAQSLPNGNVLATLSDSGHALEITRTGEVVWEFWNPTITGGKKARRDAMYRMHRFEMDYLQRSLASAR